MSTNSQLKQQQQSGTDELATYKQWINIQRSERRLKDRLPPTPTITAKPLVGCGQEYNDGKLFFKCEHMRHTGSFKERGALNFLLQMTAEQRKVGIIAASAGNHAQALAYWGKKVNTPITVVMPIAAPLVKVQNCQMLGATVVLHGKTFKEARDHAVRLAQERELLYVNGFDHPRIIEGAGVTGLEILDQVPDVETILVPVGGGGLLSGIAIAVKHVNPNITIIGVESANCPSVSESLKAKKPVLVETSVTLADGLAVPEMGPNAFKVVSTMVDKVISIPEKFIPVGILHLLEKEKMMLEGAGAAAVAGIFSGKLEQYVRGKKTVAVLCGGNIDITALGRVIERGLFCGGRLLQFDCAISDRPGGLSKFSRLLSDTGVTIKEIVQERPYISDVHICSVHVTVEARDEQHLKEMEKFMASHNYAIMKVSDGKYDQVRVSKL